MEHHGIRLMLNDHSPAVTTDLSDRDLMHKRVMGLFPTHQCDNPRSTLEVLWRVDENVDGTRFLFVTSTEPADETTTPDGYHLGVVERYDYGQYIGSFDTGATVHFRVSANPTRTETTGGKTSRVALTEHECRDWFKSRQGELGLNIRHLIVEKSPLEKVKRLRKRGGFSLAVAEFEGTAKVTDVGAFRSTLARGFGRGKAYGLGLVFAAHTRV